METARHWRMQRKRYRLEGFKREKEDGTEEFSLTGSSWFESQPNGYRRHEIPLRGEVIYQSQGSVSLNRLRTEV